MLVASLLPMLSYAEAQGPLNTMGGCCWSIAAERLLQAFLLPIDAAEVFAAGFADGLCSSHRLLADRVLDDWTAANRQSLL